MAASRQPGSELSALYLAREGGAYVDASEKGVITECPDCDDVAAGKAPSLINVTIQRKNSCPTCDQPSDNSTTAS